MDTSPQFTRLVPTGSPPDRSNDNPWVIVLSDWPAAHNEKLLRLVESAFDEARHPHHPLVLIVDDNAGSLDAAHRQRLDELTEAGAFVLEPESEAEVKTADDLNRFIAIHISAALQAVSVAATSFLPVEGYQEWLARNAQNVVSHAPTGPHPSAPSQPQGYLEFAKAVTKLSPEQIEDMMKVRK